MNRKIAAEALSALKESGYPTSKGLCQKFARLCVQNAIGHKYDGALVRPSAKEAAFSLLNAGLAFRYAGQKLEIGDLLYKTVGSGGFGHVGVLTPEGVVENSTYHWNRSGGKDARGIRSLKDYGEFHIVARFPEAKPDASPLPSVNPPTKEAPKLVVVVDGERHVIDSSVLVNGRFACGAVELLDKVGRKPFKQVNRLNEKQPRVELWFDEVAE